MVKKQDKRTKQQLLAELEALQSGQAIKETEDWFSKVFHRGPVAISIVDVEEGRYLDVNDSFLRLMEYTRQEVIGKTSVELGLYVNPADREKMTQLFKDSGRVADFGCSMRTKTGRLLDVLVSADIVLHSGKQRVVSMVVDITALRQAESAMIDSETRYRRLFESAKDGILIINAENGLIIDVNPFLQDLLGFSKTEFLGKELWEIGTFKDIIANKANFEELRRAGYIRYEDKPLKASDGRALNVEFVSNVYDVDHQKIVQCNIRDITARQRAEQALRRSEETLRIFVEHSPAAIAMFDRDMRYIVMSRRYLVDYGLKDQNLVGKLHYDVFPEITEEMKEVHRRCLAGAVESAQEDEFPRLSGRVDWVRWEMRPWHEADGVIGGVILFSEVITERKRAEEALRQSEERFRTLVENLSVGIAITSFDGKLVMANDALRRMRGYSSREELMQSTDLQRYHNPADRERWLEKMKTEGSVKDFEIQLKHKDGSLFWASFNSVAVTTASGEPQIFNVIQDITHRRQAEETLRQSEQSLRQLSEASFEGIIIHEQGKIILANEAFARMNGYELSEVIGMNVIDFTAPESRRQVTERIRGGYPGPYEVTGVRKDGSKYICEVHGTEIEYHGRRLRAAAVRDITERKKAEDRLRESEEKYRDLVNRVNDGIFATDEGGIFTFANKALAEIHCVSSPDELIGKNFLDFIVPGQREEVTAMFIQSLSAGNAPRNLEVSIMRASGGIAHLQINAVPVLENGVIVGTTGVVRDITEQRQILGQLIAAGRLASIGQLVAGIAHEMNNPLTSVIGFSELLKTRKNLPEDIREDIETVNREAKRTAGIIMGLLTFARQQKTEKELIKVNDTIQAVLQLRAYEQKVSNIEVETRFADDLPEINGNTGQMQQVFINLIVNAEQSMTDAHRRGKLTVATEHSGDTVRISVADDGGGIKPEDMPKLFTPFFTTKPVGKGTGLGLSICHGIITEHGGTIYAASEPGKGATFVIELPVGK